MNDHSLEIVRFALALHLDISPDDIRADDRLHEDLGLDALDLVLVVLRLEEVAEAEFPVAALEHVARVGDLGLLVRRWAQGDRDERSATLPPPPSVRRHDSGLLMKTPIPPIPVFRRVC